MNFWLAYALYMMSIALPSMVDLRLCFGLIIIRHFFNVCKKLIIYTDIYDIQPHFEKCMQANNTCMAGSSLDTYTIEEYKETFQYICSTT